MYRLPLCDVPEGSRTLVVWHGRLAGIFSKGGSCSPFSGGCYIRHSSRGMGVMFSILQTLNWGMLYPQCLCTASCFPFLVAPCHRKGQLMLCHLWCVHACLSIWLSVRGLPPHKMEYFYFWRKTFFSTPSKNVIFAFFWFFWTFHAIWVHTFRILVKLFFPSQRLSSPKNISPTPTCGGSKDTMLQAF